MFGIILFSLEATALFTCSYNDKFCFFIGLILSILRLGFAIFILFYIYGFIVSMPIFVYDNLDSIIFSVYNSILSIYYAVIYFCIYF
jgi:hypothetical protein